MPVLCGWGEIACRPRDAQKPAREPASQGLAEVSGSAAEMVPAPSTLTHLPGRWWAARVVGSSLDFSPLSSRSQASDFKAASLVVKSRQEPVPVL